MITIFFSFYQGKPKKSFFLFLKILPFSRSIYFFLKTFPTSPLISFFFLSPFFSFSLGANPSETPRLFPHAFSSPHTKSPPRISQKPFFFFFLPKSPLFFKTSQTSFSASAPHHFFSHSALEILTFNLGTPIHSALPFLGWAAASS